MFDLTEEQQLLQQAVREFATATLEPTVLERDDAGLWDRGLFDQAAALGLTGLYFPTEFGGSDADYLSYILAEMQSLPRMHPTAKW